MGQRLVLKAKESITIAELQDFASRALEYGLNKKNEVGIQIDEGTLRLVADLPTGVRIVGGEKRIVRPKTKKQVAVEKQINDHKEKKANGVKEAHVLPEGQKTSRVRKIKCPVCNVKKPVIKVAGMPVIKPHVVHGEPCEGGGKQANLKRVKKSASGKSDGKNT